MNTSFPAEIDGYRLRRLLGRGGMGEVYLADDTLLDRPVAIKLLLAKRQGDAARQRFMVEARAIARLQHPNVVSVYRVGYAAGVPYLVSEYVAGRSLDRVPCPVATEVALRIAMDVASGLAAAHRRGVVHRDIKPANVMLTEGGTAKLLDFGIAKLVQAPDADPQSPPAIEGPPPDPATAPTLEAPRPSEPTASTQVGRGEGEPTPSEPSEHTEPTRVGAERRAEPEGLTGTGVALGTPRYMAPEAWRGEVATFRSDVYSFGAMLFTLCAGRHAHLAQSYQELREEVLHRQAPSLREVAPRVDRRLAAVVDRCLQHDPEARFASGIELRAALSELAPGARQGAIPEGNPYRGLHAFEAEHRDLYFGRDSETRMILDRLVTDPFVLVVGDSGVGKSSLCRAAILPRLDEWMGDGRRWTAVTFVPGKHPVASLGAALAPVLGLDEQALASRIVDDPGGFARELRAWRGETHGIALFADQLEELVTWSDPAEASFVAEALGWLVVRAPGARLLATVRGDFLSRVANLPRIGEEVAPALYFLRPLTDERIRDAIVRPAAAKGGCFGSDALVEELVASTVRAGRGGLPLLQFALAELWDARGPDDVVSEATLAAVGGVAGALSRHADGVLAALDAEQKSAARGLLTRLVTAEGTRARKLESELGLGARTGEPPPDAATSAALAALVRGRLVVASDTAEGPAYEIAHEALIGAWQTLASWLAGDAEAHRVGERLAAAVAEWERLGRRREALWGAPRLAELAALPGVSMGERERRFVHASERRQQLVRASRLAAVLALPLLVLVVYGGLKWRERQALGARVDAALGAARTSVNAARALRVEAESRRRAALDLFDRTKREAGERAWSRYLQTDARLGEAYGRASQLLETAVLMDLTRADTRDAFAEVLYEQALLAELHHDPRRTGELLGRLAVYDSGERRGSWDAPAEVRLVVDPPSASAKLSRYVLGAAGDYGEQPVEAHLSRGQRLLLAPGSYRATFQAPGRATVHYPFFVTRGQRVVFEVRLPAAKDVPAGFVFVPPGWLLFGSAADEHQRRDFLHTVPRHAVHTGGYLIAARETTFGDWLRYLEALPAGEREKRLPRVGKGGFKGALSLVEIAGGGWQLTFQPTDTEYGARAGESIVYRGRDRRARHDWLRMPVVGIAVADADAYAAWLSASGRVPGARLCTGKEWERGARGADGRSYPHGERLAPDQANHDATYGKRAEAMGPDEVGTYPASRSPFGLDDMAGNVWEWTRSSLDERGYAARGGSWYFGPSSARSTEREETEASFRDVSVGMRVCADPPWTKRSSATQR